MQNNNDSNQTIKQHYSQTEFQKWGIDVVKQKMANVERNITSENFENRNGLVLDVGCGGGRLTSGLMDGQYKNIVGIDLCYGFCKIYRKSFTLPCIQGDVMNLSIKKNTFDYVMCMSNVLSFLSTPKQHELAFTEIHRILKTRGTVCISVLNYNGRWFNKVLYSFLKVVRLTQTQPPTGRNLPWMKYGENPNFGFYKAKMPQSYWFKKEEVAALLLKTGFKIIDFDRTKGAITGAALFYAAQKV
jgi:ubiquinone/menaquinone biosynthesis C-methylase UbiE